MSKETYFTQDELAQLVKPTADKAAEALEAGDYEKAKKLYRSIERENQFFIHIFEEWVAILLSYIGRNFGSDEVYKALRSIAEVYFKPIYESGKKLDMKSLIQSWAGSMRTHTARGFIRVTEDEEKFTFELNPCGSGARMIRAGFYGPPKNLLKLKGPQPLTFGMDELPVYCAHCAVLHQIAPIDWGGAHYPVISPAQDPIKEPCFMYFYKDPKDIPEAYYKRVGKQK